MKKYLALLLFSAASACTQPAAAYDDEVAAKAYISCLIDAQQRTHDTDGRMLIPQCERQADDFIRYVCFGNVDQCYGSIYTLAYKVAQGVK